MSVSLFRAAACAAAVLLLAASANAAELYRWVDDKGVTHYGDVVPERYRAKATRVGTSPPPTDAQRRDAIDRAARDRAAAAELSARKATPPAPRSTGNAAPSPPTDPRQRCKAEWDRYRASDECFAPFRNRNGSVRAEAFEQCEPVTQPDCNEDAR